MFLIAKWDVFFKTLENGRFLFWLKHSLSSCSSFVCSCDLVSCSPLAFFSCIVLQERRKKSVGKIIHLTMFTTVNLSNIIKWNTISWQSYVIFVWHKEGSCFFWLSHWKRWSKRYPLHKHCPLSLVIPFGVEVRADVIGASYFSICNI